MKISNLCQNRLQISINSLKNHPNISDTLFQTLSQIFEYLNENRLNVQFIESQLITKVSSSEFNFGLSQKLSMVQFLQYFGKVQKIMESLQRKQKNEQQKLEKVVAQQTNKIAHIDQIVESISRDWDRKKKSQQLEQQTFRVELKEVRKKVEKWKAEEEKQNIPFNKQYNMLKIAEQFKDLEQCCSDMKSNIDQLVKDFKFTVEETRKTSIGHNTANMQDKKFVTFDQLRVVLSQLESSLTASIGSYLSDFDKDGPPHNHNRMNKKQNTISSENDYSCQSVTNSNITSKNTWLNQISNEVLLTPTFNPTHYLKESINHPLEAQLSTEYLPSFTIQWKSNILKSHHSGKKANNKVSFLKPNLSKSIILNQKNTNKFSSEISKSSTKPQSLNSSQIMNRSNYSKYAYEVSNQTIILREKGFYQLKCGFLPVYPSELVLLLNEQVIASHVFTEMPRKYICRAIMMYIQVEFEGAEVKIYCSGLDDLEKRTQETSGCKSGKKKNRLESQNTDGISMHQSNQIKGFLCIKKLT